MELFDAVEALAALGHESRLQIFRLLVQVGPDGIPAGQIAEALGIPPATLNFHLGHLQRARLITSQRASRHIIYRADYPTMGQLMSFLTENCCQGVCEKPTEKPNAGKAGKATSEPCCGDSGQTEDAHHA